MESLAFALDRLHAFLAEVREIAEAEFPYPDSRVALKILGQLFETKLVRLQGFDKKSDPSIVRQECKLSVSALFHYVPLLGFILRSTNVRNAFELCAPLLRLAKQVLEYDVDTAKRTTRLILSSEWDYSPFVYRDIPDLPGMVLIGLPAPESSNPLLIPLAGHELGHSVWSRRELGAFFKPVAREQVLTAIRGRWKEFEEVSEKKSLRPEDLTNDMFCVQFWEQAVVWCLRQAEESFCDFVGVRLFHLSYLDAFAYLLSPGTVGARSPYYPRMKNRVRHLENAANACFVSVPPGYTDLFDDGAEPNLIQSDLFRLSVADEALEEMVGRLTDRANQEITAAGFAAPSKEEVKMAEKERTRIWQRFRHVIPAEGCRGIADILNAAWHARRDPDSLG